MLPSAAGFILGSMLTPVLARRARPVVAMAGGLLLVAVGFLLLTQLDSATGLPVLVTGSVVFSLGLAPVDTLAADLTVGAASAERAGPASAISETGAELGGTLGIAIYGVVGGAAAGQLPDPLGQTLLDAAHQAFTQGLHLAFAVSAAAATGAAILAIGLRVQATPGEPDDG